MAHLSGKKVIFVINKSDLGIRVTSESIERILPEQIPSVNKDDGKEYRFLHLSALTGEGIEMLSEEIRRMVYNGEVTAESEILVPNVGPKDLLERSLRSLFDASEMLRAGEALDFAETDIRSAWSLLGEIIGETVSQDILTEVFSRFCLGK